MASDSEKNPSVREDQLIFMRGVVAGSVFLLLVALYPSTVPYQDLRAMRFQVKTGGCFSRDSQRITQK